VSARTPISVEGAPQPYAGAPYSQAILAGGFVFTAGQVGMDAASGQLVEGGVAAQTRRTLENVRCSRAPVRAWRASSRPPYSWPTSRTSPP
jgi:2-iminobutanoate/2-iminopropanoate deaminase